MPESSSRRWPEFGRVRAQRCGARQGLRLAAWACWGLLSVLACAGASCGGQDDGGDMNGGEVLRPGWQMGLQRANG